MSQRSSCSQATVLALYPVHPSPTPPTLLLSRASVPENAFDPQDIVSGVEHVLQGRDDRQPRAHVALLDVVRSAAGLERLDGAVGRKRPGVEPLVGRHHVDSLHSEIEVVGRVSRASRQ